MRRYVIDVHGDNDDLHKRALEAGLKEIERINNRGTIAATIEAPPPAGFPPILNCTRRVK